MKIAVVELDTHQEVLINTINLFKETEHDVHIFTTDRILNNQTQEQVKNIKFTVKGSKEKIAPYLKEILPALNRCDLIIFNTIENYFFLLYKLTLTPPVILRIHNSNTYFNVSLKDYKFPANLFYLYKDLSFFIRRVVLKRAMYFRKKLLKNIDYYLFTSEAQLAEAYNLQYINPRKIIPFSLSYTFHHPEYVTEKSNNSFTLVVPGKVDQRRRDYEQLIQIVSELGKKTEISIDIILLGRASDSYGRSIVSKLEQQAPRNIRIVSFSQFIPQKDFDKYIKTADLILIPINVRTRYKMFPEFYGKTKISGNIMDCIKYNKPGLIQEKYPLDENLKVFIKTYDNAADASDKILRYINTPDALPKIDIKTSPYNKTTVIQKLEKIIQHCTSTGNIS